LRFTRRGPRQRRSGNVERMCGMVRLEDADDRDLVRGGSDASCCTVPAGESPVRVGAGAPGSRPQARGEIRATRAGRQEPLRRKQERGPQHEVKPAASSDPQRESLAAHATAKATSTAQSSGVESVEGLPGVWGAARVQGAMQNWRGPSVRPVSGRGVSSQQHSPLLSEISQDPSPLRDKAGTTSGSRQASRAGGPWRTARSR
jgi:hypothetical protein